MKTLIRQNTNVSLYLFDDAETVVMTATETTIGNPPTRIVQDCHTGNATLVSDVTAPQAWTGWKYLYDGQWTLNPDWVEPEQGPEQP